MQKFVELVASIGFWILLALAAIVLSLMSLVSNKGDISSDFGYIIAIICLFTSIAAFLMLLLFYAMAMKPNMANVSVGALGLPEGSIRAFLAIGLLSLVAVFGTFIYFESGKAPATSEVASFNVKTLAEVKDLLAASKPDITISYSFEPGMKDGQPAAELDAYRVTYYTVATMSDRNDLAKQILTMIMTLLTTVVGFYFGSRSAEGQKEGGSAPPAETARRDQLLTLRSEMTGVAADLKTRLEKARTAIDGMKAEGEKADAITTAQNKLKAVPPSVATALDTLTNAATSEMPADDRDVANQLASLQQARKDVEKAIVDLEAALKLAQ